MKLFALPEIVSDAILGSAVGVASQLDPTDFVNFWNETLSADYSDPMPVAKDKEVSPLRAISPMTTQGYIPEHKE